MDQSRDLNNNQRKVEDASLVSPRTGSHGTKEIWETGNWSWNPIYD